MNLNDLATLNNKYEAIKSSPQIIYFEYISSPKRFTVFLYTSLFIHFPHRKTSNGPKSVPLYLENFRNSGWYKVKLFL